MKDWQLINTAPKDRWILAVREGWVPLVALWSEKYQTWSSSDIEEIHEDVVYRWQPTHWHELPEFPILYEDAR